MVREGLCMSVRIMEIKRQSLDEVPAECIIVLWTGLRDPRHGIPIARVGNSLIEKSLDRFSGVEAEQLAGRQYQLAQICTMTLRVGDRYRSAIRVTEQVDGRKSEMPPEFLDVIRHIGAAREMSAGRVDRPLPRVVTKTIVKYSSKGLRPCFR